MIPTIARLTLAMIRPFRDQRGTAFLLAMLALLILSPLIVGFLGLTATEPTIANNQLRVAQARALAEAGVERAIWALSAGKLNPGALGSLDYPLPDPVPAPYSLGQLFGVTAGAASVGGFRVRVTQGAASNERNVEAVGWVPDDGVNTPTKAHQRLMATVMDFNFNPFNMPCAVCVRGDIQIGGNSTIDSRGDTSCGNKYGTWSTRVVDGNGNVISPGDTTIGSGAARIYGADGNQTGNESTDMAVRQSPSAFDSNAFRNEDLDALKAYAKSKGTYFQGAVAFDSSNKMPNGIIFVDTVSGHNIDPATTSTSDYGSISINGNASLDETGFHGWIISNGSISISGNVSLYGLVYALNDFSYTGTGTGQVVGQMISQNVKDTIATVIDTSLAGNSSVTYNCADAKNPGNVIPQKFMLKPGTYKEVPD